MSSRSDSKVEGRGNSQHREGLGIIESVLGRGSPVLGLYLYTAFSKMMDDVRRDPEYRKISPHLIGTPSILLQKPFISQTQLAKYLGCGRATAGLQVSACVKLGWVRRTRSPGDGRKYVLELTDSGRLALEEVSDIIATHEKFMAADLTLAERKLLRSLLSRLITGR